MAKLPNFNLNDYWLLWNFDFKRDFNPKGQEEKRLYVKAKTLREAYEIFQNSKFSKQKEYQELNSINDFHTLVIDDVHKGPNPTIYCYRYNILEEDERGSYTKFQEEVIIADNIDQVINHEYVKQFDILGIWIYDQPIILENKGK